VLGLLLAIRSDKTITRGDSSKRSVYYYEATKHEKLRIILADERTATFLPPYHREVLALERERSIGIDFALLVFVVSSDVCSN
jgi:hypothetical protein